MAQRMVEGTLGGVIGRYVKPFGNSQFGEGRTGNERKVLAKDCPLDKALHGNQHPFPSASRFNAHKGSVPLLSTQKYKEVGTLLPFSLPSNIFSLAK
ncbi:hypothetical protein PVL29_000434 [Vitis rotundifolia]|uniref:Uncharacterized protein n=1 Tax=Vitis rotundifolia TaxID=103349 RepID=A0AA39E3Q0_VITRO|nr:hypothetical protein PVL29_000434 [Vitis rotundifolia]